jgi:transcriptional regulator with XRE-family HTH domain
MNDLHLGLALRAVRVKRRLRQCDLAGQAGVSASLVSRLEHGDFDRVSLRAFRGVAAKLGVSLELVPRSAGGELDRVLSARHAALGERVAAWIARRPGWIVAAEVSFAIYGERGIVDLLAWHESTNSLVVIELKTAIVDVDELIGTLDRKRRLAAQIAASRGWASRSVSAWLIVGDSSTNRRRVADHRTLLTSALPRDGQSLAPLFLHPEQGPESGIAFWSNLPGVKVGHPIVARQRVVKRRPAAGEPEPRSGPGSMSGQ